MNFVFLFEYEEMFVKLIRFLVVLRFILFKRFLQQRNFLSQRLDLQFAFFNNRGCIDLSFILSLSCRFLWGFNIPFVWSNYDLLFLELHRKRFDLGLQRIALTMSCFILLVSTWLHPFYVRFLQLYSFLEFSNLLSRCLQRSCPEQFILNWRLLVQLSLKSFVFSSHLLILLLQRSHLQRHLACILMTLVKVHLRCLIGKLKSLFQFLVTQTFWLRRFFKHGLFFYLSFKFVYGVDLHRIRRLVAYTLGHGLVPDVALLSEPVLALSIAICKVSFSHRTLVRSKRKRFGVIHFLEHICTPRKLVLIGGCYVRSGEVRTGLRAQPHEVVWHLSLREKLV